ncbi:hypothetical protein [Mesorhizobium sp.]|uniref:hypothetical protein n=1 Tax=Mesorhizobium sp. TaxID=1871066 RepID=UPI000FE96FCC|nr:hypothetical protein [Mesorhizobium sp.]RWD62672.1 MAG: hypothetical protein EOS37_30505 [Mesorhizobium sp.]TIV56433.1 MAG: hypothetical protein E5V80_26925 [Mesorhizobium sp.]
MSDTSFPILDDGYNRYLFEYRHDGTEWGIEIKARSPQDAKERIKSLTWARYKGEIKATVHIPTGGFLARVARRFLQAR